MVVVISQLANDVTQKAASHAAQHLLLWAAGMVFLADEPGYLRKEGLEIRLTEGDALAYPGRTGHSMQTVVCF